jgi:hypothetical protein
MIATCGVAGAVVNIKKCATITDKGDMETSLTLFGFLLFGFLILFLGWWFQHLMGYHCILLIHLQALDGQFHCSVAGFGQDRLFVLAEAPKGNEHHRV